MSGPIVTTPDGTVRGVRRADGSIAFLSIPFAEPPVGDLRFAAPVPRRPWVGVRDATAYGPTAQRRPFGEVTAIPEPSIPGDDILTVNVFTPDTTATLPVLFWIHGGGYKAGSPASPWYDGFAFARDGVVTVSVGYRLGFDGFGAVDGAPANRGLLDQIEGLRWVRRTIAAFGGDPDNVTIAGQSAGGGSVLALMASPAARGLFRAGISQSGALAPVPVDVAARRTARLAEITGVSATLDGLRSLSPDAILDATELMEAPPADGAPSPEEAVDAILTGGGIGGLQFLPQVDPDTLPSDWVQAIGRNDLPLLMGTVAHEFTAVGQMMGPILGDADPVDLLRRGRLGDLADEYAAAHRDLPGPLLIGQLMTDITFRQWVPVVASARTAPTWAYDFRWPNATTGLVFHCADLPFAWDNLAEESVVRSCGPDAPQSLADAMHSAWVRFIASGSAPWTPWTPASPRTMVFDSRPHEEDGYTLEARLAARVGGSARRSRSADPDPSPRSDQ